MTSCSRARRRGQSSELGNATHSETADVRYEWLNKKHRVSSSASKFSRFAEAPGTFSVKSVALKENEVCPAGLYLIELTSSASARSQAWTE